MQAPWVVVPEQAHLEREGITCSPAEGPAQLGRDDAELPGVKLPSCGAHRRHILCVTNLLSRSAVPCTPPAHTAML